MNYGKQSGMSEERLEAMLRGQRSIELSEGFRRNVMQSVGRLPAPRYADLPHGRLDLAWLLRQLGLADKLGLGITGLGLLLLLVPGVSETLGNWQLALGSLELNLSVGDSAASLSLLSLIGVGLCAGFMGILGSFAARNKLISA